MTVRNQRSVLSRILDWFGVTLIAGIAAVLSWGIVDAVNAGEIRGPSKAGEGVLHVLTLDPVGFWAAVAANLILAGVFWGGAYWFWSTQMRGGRHG